MLLALSILVIGGLITYYQSKIEKLVIPEKIIVVKSQNDIKRGEIIKGKDLEEVEIYVPDRHPKAIGDMSEAIGKVAITDIVEDRAILKNELMEKEKWFQEDERLLGIKFSDFTDMIGGDAQPGDVVDVMVSYPRKEMPNGEISIKPPELVVGQIRIVQIFDTNNVSFVDTKEKAFKPITALFKLTNQEESAIDIAQKKGRIYLRKHGNQIQKEKATKKNKVMIQGGGIIDE